ncbi:MAG: hypothetical protein ABI678_33215 [Kofleriaceae bacterium]
MVRAHALWIVAAACHAAPPRVEAPAFQPIATESVSARGELYVACLADAVANKRIGYAHDPTTHVLLFTCTTEPARAFYDGLAARSVAVGSEVAVGTKTLRATNRVHRDLFGVDYCTKDATTTRA